MLLLLLLFCEVVLLLLFGWTKQKVKTGVVAVELDLDDSDLGAGRAPDGLLRIAFFRAGSCCNTTNIIETSFIYPRTLKKYLISDILLISNM